MKLFDLNKLLEDKDLVDKRIKDYLEKSLLKIDDKDKPEIEGHVEKAEHNLKFVSDNLKLGYFDWCITGCYYTVYHLALALILKKGYYSKNHDATLSVLIKEYYKNVLVYPSSL